MSDAPSGGLVNQKVKSPLQIVKDWWGIVVITIAVLGGYFWLEKNYARIEQLAAEKCSLSYEIRIATADIQFKNVDEEVDRHRSELEDLLQLAAPPQKRVEFKKGFIKSLEARAEEIIERKVCLERAKGKCFQGDTNTEKCYD